MESHGPVRATPPSGRRKVRNRTLAALGLLALPLTGSALLAPAVAGAASTADEISEQVVAASGAGEAVADTEPPAPAPVTVESLPSEADPVASEPATDVEGQQVDAFFAAGYTVDDAATLAQLWDLTDALQAKITAGTSLQQGIPLRDAPFANASYAEGYDPDALVDLFVNVGYTGEDAFVLAEEWGTTIREAKVKAGRELKTVGVLPFVDPIPFAAEPAPAEPTPPGTGVDPADAPLFDAYFAAGYDYDDAVVLAEYWGLPDFVAAKLKAGALLQAGDPGAVAAGLGES